MAKDRIDDAILSVIPEIRKNQNQADVDNTHKQIIKTADFDNIAKEVLADRIHTLIIDGKVVNKINRNADSFYVNEKYINTESWNLQNTSPIIPDKSFYTPTISIPITSTENPLISPNENPVTTKSTKPDHRKTSQNSSNLTHVGTDDLHAK